MSECEHDDEYIDQLADDAERCGQLEEENARLRDALMNALSNMENFDGEGWTSFWSSIDIARTALGLEPARR